MQKKIKLLNSNTRLKNNSIKIFKYLFETLRV